MRKGKVALSILCLIVTFLACNKDDGGNTITPVEDRDRNEQQMADKDSIVQYLNGHYYNASAFDNNPNASIADLIITKLPDNGVLPDPTNNEILMDAVELKSVVYANTDYEFYILNLNPGGGEAPNFADQVRVKYEGFTLDNEVFDSAVTPIDFDLLSLVPGWRKAIPFFNTAVSFVDNGDGTVDYTNHGVGVMFIPSGLGYFSNPTQTIPAYSPLVFKFDLFETSLADHDSDGVPSYLEDLNGDGEFTFHSDANTKDGDDTDSDNITNHFDNDDDGDGVLTINEDIDGDGDPTNDIGANGIPKYLDATETASKQ